LYFYEDFVLDPVGHARHVAAFLGVDVADDDVAAIAAYVKLRESPVALTPQFYARQAKKLIVNYDELLTYYQ
jgi:hypothetical protein